MVARGDPNQIRRPQITGDYESQMDHVKKTVGMRFRDCSVPSCSLGNYEIPADFEHPARKQASRQPRKQAGKQVCLQEPVHPKP